MGKTAFYGLSNRAIAQILRYAGVETIDQLTVRHVKMLLSRDFYGENGEFEALLKPGVAANFRRALYAHLRQLQPHIVVPIASVRRFSFELDALVRLGDLIADTSDPDDREQFLEEQREALLRSKK